jgi:hypothetical protein
VLSFAPEIAWGLEIVALREEISVLKTQEFSAEVEPVGSFRVLGDF